MSPEIPNRSFASTKEGGKERAANSWSQEALKEFKEDQIISTLEAVKNKSASQWHTEFGRGKTSPHITALQGALKLLYLRDPVAFRDPGKIDGVYANLKNGAPDLANSKTARAMEVITGKRYIDNEGIEKLIAAIRMNNAAKEVQTRVENTGKPNEELREMRGNLIARITNDTNPDAVVGSFGEQSEIAPTADGKFKIKGLEVVFANENDAITVVKFIHFCERMFKTKGENERPWHIQPISGDLEFNRADQYFDVEIIDNGTKKLPAEIRKAANLRRLAEYLNSLGGWEAAKKAA